MDSLTPLDPAIALERIRTQGQRVVAAALVPAWYWWAVAVLTVGLCAVVDARMALWTVLAALSYALIVAMLSSTFVFGIGRRLRVRSEVLGERGAVSIVGFVWLAVGLSLGVGFLLQLVGISHPALAAGIVAAAVLVFGGPALMKRLRRVMLRNLDSLPDA